MSGENGELQGDALDQAIASAEASDDNAQKTLTDLHSLTADFVFDKGGSMKLTVPVPFDSDQFETAISILIQLRVKADQIMAARNAPKILTPDKPKIVGLDGRRLT